MKKMTILLLFVSNFLFAQSQFDVIDYNNLDTNLLQELVINQINKFRAKNNLTPFKFDSVSYKAAEYQSSYLVQNSMAKSRRDIVFNYYNELPHKGILLNTPWDRLEYFSSLERVNRRLLNSINITSFSPVDMFETYEIFAMGSLETWLSTPGTIRETLLFEGDGEELIGASISFREVQLGSEKGFEIYMDVVITTDK